MLLSVAYAASIGGTGVITGTPSNLIILEVLSIECLLSECGNSMIFRSCYFLGLAT